MIKPEHMQILSDLIADGVSKAGTDVLSDPFFTMHLIMVLSDDICKLLQLKRFTKQQMLDAMGKHWDLLFQEEQETKPKPKKKINN